MRVQIKLEDETKGAAENAARQMGYPSLAALLKVLASNLARQNMIGKPEIEPNKDILPMPPQNTPPPPSLEPTIVQRPTLPAPEQFTIW
ncbi:MAG TPA: hypothetical protein VF272_03295, partial [Candidatus Saccharimonadia bacterium]